MTWNRGVGLLLAVSAGTVVGCASEPTADVDDPLATVPIVVDDDTFDDGASQPEQTVDMTTVAAGGTGTVSVAVRIPLNGLDETLSVDLSDLEGADPLERFASCTGLQVADARAYTVAVTDTDTSGRMSSFQILADETITGPGAYAATIQLVDRGVSLVGPGELVLDEGARSGSFSAEATDGAVITGTFECAGPDPVAEQVETGPLDGVLDSVELSARIRTDDGALVVSLAVGADTIAADPETVRCSGEPFVAGGRYTVTIDSTFDNSVGQIETAVIESDASVGAPGEFPGTVRLVVLGVEYASAAATIVLNDDQASGTFSGATADGIDIDGAFRCT